MSTDRTANIEELLKRGLADRAAGGSDELFTMILQAAELTAQRRSRWVGAMPSRRTLALVALAALVAAMAGATIVGSLVRPSPVPDLTLGYHHNGSILVLNDGVPVQVVDIGAQALAARVELPPLADTNRLSWSPDGMRLVYTNPTELWVADLTTGATRKILDCPTGCIPAWSPRGSEIAVSHEGIVDLVTPAGGPVASFPLPVERLSAMTWAPDGARIAIVTDGYTDFTSSTMYVVNRDGSGLRPLPEAAAPGTAIFDLAWAPDGSRIAYNNSDRSAEGSRWALTLVTIYPDASHRTVISPAGFCYCINVYPGGVAWSPDGTRIALGKPPGTMLDPEDPDQGLFIVNPATGESQKVGTAWEFPAWRPVP